MLPIYICEDDTIQLKTFEKRISSILEKDKLSDKLQVVCATSSSKELLFYLKRHREPSLYFLDIDLGENTLNGIELGVQIRKYDPRGYIVLVTTHTECVPQVFRLKIEAMDYIVKDFFEEVPGRIRDCILHAYKLYTAPDIVDTDEEIRYIEAMGRRIRVYKGDGYDELNQSLKEVYEDLGHQYFQCHKSYIVNLFYIQDIDATHHMLLMKDGSEIPISYRKLPALKKLTESMSSM